MHQASAGGSERGRAPFTGFGVPQSIGRVGGNKRAPQTGESRENEKALTGSPKPGGLPTRMLFCDHV